MYSKKDIKDIYFLTSMQEGMLFTYLMDEQSSAYLEQFQFSISGEFDRTIFEKTVNLLIAKYDVLRTVFVYKNVKRPVQVVLKQRDLTVRYEDLQGLSDGERVNALNEWKQQDKAAGFQLAAETPMRLCVFQTAADKYEIIWTFHHIILDGWSVGVLLREFLILYHALRKNRPVRIGKTQPFSQYVKWLEAQDKAKVLSYWKDYLHDYEQQTGIPLPKEKNAAADYVLEEVNFDLSEAVTGQLEQVARANAVTLSTVFHTLWGIVLQKYNDVNDVVFGSVVSGRPAQLKGIEKTVGCFINTIPVRIARDEQTTFANLLQRVRDDANQANGFDYMALSEIQSQSQLKKDLINHVLVFENYPLDVGALLPDRKWLGFSVDNLQAVEQTNYDINVVTVPGERMSIRLGYNAAMYDRAFIEGVQRHFEALATALVASPDKPIREIGLLGGEEAMRSLPALTVEKGAAQDTSYAQRFERQVELTPDLTAVAFQGQTLTYRELNAKANQLARALRTKGADVEQIVAIACEPSLDTVVAILGVLKSGAAYLPIDVSFTADRIEYMLQDSGAQLLLTQSHLQEALAPEWVEVVLLDDPTLYVGETKNLPITNDPADVVYTIYTSGTTGRPKGVLLTHSNLLNYVNWFVGKVGLTAGEATALTSSFAFDLGYTSLFPALASGCTVHLLAKETYMSPEQLLETIESERITYLKLTPSLYTTMINSHHFTAEHFASMRFIVLGGEAIILKDVEKTFTLCPHLQVMNHYGPTETTIGAIAHLFGAEEFAAFKEQPTIGQPIDQASVLILDKDRNVLPTSVAGEIYIAGAGVGIGYLNRDDLTAEKFLTVTIGEQTVRLYRTGDKGRYLPDGRIEFLGRMDDQVKIRGYRIEPGEVEHRLTRHELVTEAVVVGKQDELGLNYLCAYYVADRQMEMHELRTFLADKLPDYMIPTYFIQLDELPLTPNGKVNKRELPEPERGMGVGTHYEAPRNKTEEKLVLIWQEVLGADGIGVHDDFFLLGGHSLKAMMLVSRISKEFGVEVPLKHLFAAPTIAGVAERIRMSSQQTQIAIRKVEPKPTYKTSSAQQRIYVLSERDPDSTVYNMPHVFEVEGELDITRLEQALRALIERHESLRTSFFMDGNEIVQRVAEQVEFTLHVREAGNEKRAEIIRQFIRPFDVSHSPLLRAQVVKYGEEEHLFMFDIHHIISDGVSTGIIFRELMELYQRRKLAPVPLQYKEYAEWQAEFATSDALKAQQEFWKEQLQGELPVLNLPTDAPRPAVQSVNGDFLEFALNPNLYAKLTKLSRETRTTLFSILLGAYNILLAKYTGQEDIIVGTVTAGRPHADLQGTLGMFVNTLALRNAPTGDKVVKQFLQDVQSRALEAFEHQDFQFEDLLDVLHIQRDVSRNPIFDTVFVYGNMDIPDLKVEELTFSPLAYDYHIAKFDLTLSAEERGNTCCFRLEYCTDLFQKATVQRLQHHFIRLLTEIAEGLEGTISDLDMMSEAEKQLILQEFNQTTTAYPKDKTIPHLFEEQVANHPDKTALVFEDREMSYGELNERANQVAHLLRENGVQAGAIVAMITERSFEMIVGIFGILKAGAAYLPIDPEYSEERIHTILDDSQTKWLVTHRNVQAKVNALGDTSLAATIWLDELTPAGEPLANPEGTVDAQGLAYVMYTSGSTGKPKGNLTTHFNITRVVKETNYIEITPSDTLLQLSTYAFDGSTFDIFGALLNGAKLVLLKKQVIGDMQKLSRLITEERISVFFVTTALFNTIVDLNVQCLADVRHVLFGGERVSIPHVEKALAVMGPGKILHVYGPTESTVFATYYPLDLVDESGVIPIGRPLANTQIYVINAHQQLQPVGVVGEIVIAGDGLARGYLNRPELTAEKFVDSPFVPGQKLYRTGDLGRWLPDGAIDFFGRIDHQVKIRGYRVELGEIETHLLRYEGVKEAIVIAREAQQGYKYLVAYLVGEVPIEIADVREHLSEQLPDYMIPSFFVQMEQFPLTPSGKVNQRELPEPDARHASDVAFEAPRNETEHVLAELWQEGLGVANPSIHDDFFSLGGHSLKAMVLLAKIRQHFQVEMSLLDLFESPTIKGLGEYIESAAQGSIITIPQAAEQEYYPASSAQKRMFALAQFADSGVNYNIPYPLLVEGNVDVDRLQTALNAMVARHEALRTSFDMLDGQVVQRIADEVTTVNLSLEQMHDVEITDALERLVRPFDLGQAPLMRAGLASLHDGRTLLVIDMHHIIADGVSAGLLIRDLFDLYAGKALSAQTLQYKDYAVWEQEFATSDAMAQHKAFWLEQFAGEIPVLQLPTDFPRPAVQEFAGASLVTSIDGALLEQVKQIAKETGTTLYMVLVSAYNLLLRAYSGQEDIIIGTVTAGRNYAQLQDIVGMFVGTLAMRNFPAGQKTVRTFLEEVKQRTLRSFEHGEYPFEQLVEALQIPREPSRNPLFDTMLVLENIAGMELGEGELRGTLYEWDQQIAKFDLSLVVEEHRDELFVKWEYRTNLFLRSTVEQMHDHLQHVLREMVAGLDRTIGELEVVTAEEKQRLLVDFQPPQEQEVLDSTVLAMFEAQAARTPDALAIAYENERLSFGELNAKADQLAHVLRAKGVQAESLVGIMLDRSPVMAVAMLAVWKAGGAYVPIDPYYPQDRIRYMLEDSHAQLLLTKTAWMERASFAGEVLDLTGDWPLVEQAGKEATPPQPHDLAYVIYTSGTTGRPKGVAVEHRNIFNTIDWRATEYGLGAEDAVLQLFSFSFDGFLTSFLTPLVSGSMTVFVPDEEAKDPLAIKQLIERHRVTHFISVPSLYAAVLEVATAEELASLRIITLAGEKVGRHLVEKSKTLLPHVELVNEYGPTENSVASTILRDVEAVDDIPIGKPIRGTQVLILNADGKLVPIGVPGELCVAGRGLVRGYLHRPDTTAEKFIAHPYVAGARLYKTGDAAKWSADGQLHFLGRIDHQIKVRGYRVEAGEIENELLQHAAVRDAVVVGREDEKGRGYLCAYLVTSEPVSTQDLRRFLGASLPDYMVPSYFVEMERLPLTANGKVDVNVLPEPNRTRETVYVAPRTDAEQQLADLWSQVLGAERVSVQDDFFELGGDSLKAIALVSAVYKEQGVRLNLTDVFQHPTVEQLALVLTQTSDVEVVERIVPVERRETYPVSSAQKRMFVLQQFEKSSTVYNMPILLRFSGTFEFERLTTALRKLIARHEPLRTTFAMQTREVVQIVHETSELMMQYQDVQEAQLVERVKQAVQPFDLTKGPLFRIHLFRLGTNEHALLLDLHHIIADGVTVSLLLQEIADLYDGQERAPLTIQYKDFAVWQERFYQSTHFRKQEQFWLDTFREPAPAILLPPDHERGATQSFAGDGITFQTGRELSEQIKQVAAQAGATLYMVLLASYNVLLHKYSGQEDVVIGCGIAGRNHADVETMFGMFVNTIAIRNRPQGVLSFQDFLADVKQQTLQAFENQDYPFEELVDKLQLPRTNNQNPLFQTVFELQNVNISDIASRNLQMRVQDLESGHAKFDFTLFAGEQGDELHFYLNYCSDLFKRETMEQMSRDFLSILQTIAENPSVTLQEIAVSQIERVPAQASPAKKKVTFTF